MSTRRIFSISCRFQDKRDQWPKSEIWRPCVGIVKIYFCQILIGYLIAIFHQFVDGFLGAKVVENCNCLVIWLGIFSRILMGFSFHLVCLIQSFQWSINVFSLLYLFPFYVVWYFMGFFSLDYSVHLYNFLMLMGCGRMRFCRR